MSNWKRSLISGLKAFAVAAIAQMAIMVAQGQDCWTAWQIWAVAGLAAVIKGGEKAVGLNQADKKAAK